MLFFRIDIGGKALTNLLKEWVSYRQLNVLEETYVMNECKEDVCYVADDFQRHMDIAKYCFAKKKKRETENKFGIVKNIFLIKASWQGEFDY